MSWEDRHPWKATALAILAIVVCVVSLWVFSYGF